MTRTKKLNKLLTFLFSVFLGVAVLGSGVVNAQNNTCNTNSGLGSVFGCSIVNSDGGFDVNSVITLVFQFVIGAAVLWVVWNIVLAGIKIAGAKEDADKRKEGIQAVINALIGLVVALLAWGVVVIVANTVGGNIREVGTPCTFDSKLTTGLVKAGTIQIQGGNRVCVSADGTDSGTPR